MATERKPAAAQGWGACKRALKDWPRPGVVGLVQELYRLSDENRRYLHTRLLTEHAAESLAAAVKAVKRMISADVVFRGGFRHADVKRVIDQFAKASDDPAAVASLLLEDLAVSLETFSEIGDFEPIVDHIYATMARLEKVLAEVAPSAAGPLVAKLHDLAERWRDSFGYGVSDELYGMAIEWHENMDQKSG